MAAPSAGLKTSGIYADRVRNVFGMTSGAHSSTSDSASLRKMTATTEANAATSAANDNRMIAEMQLQTKLLKSIAGGTKGFGLTDFLLGTWLSKLSMFAGRGLLAGAAVGAGVAGKAVSGIRAAVGMAATGAANMIKGTILGVIRPIANGVSTLFKPLVSLGRSIGGMLRVPAISGAITGMIKAAPNMLKTFGGLASKIFLPLTIIMGAIDGVVGAFNAEKILGRGNLNIFDRLVSGVGSIINGLLFGIPDWIAKKFGASSFTSALDKAMDPIRNLAGSIAENVGKLFDQVKSYIPNPMEFAGRFGNSIKRAAMGLGGFLKDQFFGMIDTVKNWFANPTSIGAAIGKFVSTKVIEFGVGVKNNLFGMFDAIGAWARSSFENLKTEIMNWMPWNWNVNPQAANQAGAAFGSGVIKPGAVVRQPSSQSSPLMIGATKAPLDVARLSAAMGPGANDALPVVSAVVSTGVATQTILQNTAIGQVESIDEALKEVVEVHEQSMEKMTDEMSDSFLDQLGGAMQALGLAYKPVADALSQVPGDLVKYLSGTPNGGDLLNIPGMTSAINALGTGNVSGTGVSGVNPALFSPSGPTVSSQSGVVPPVGTVVPSITGSVGGPKQIDANMLEAAVTNSNRNAVMAAMVDRAIQGGLAPEHAIGLIANFQGESLDPTNNTGDGGRAFGIGQWHPDRQAKLREYARITGKNPNLRSTQIDFSLHEMGISKDPASTSMTSEQRQASGWGTEGSAGRKLLATQTPAQAAAVAVYDYERPADKPGQANLRGGYANDLANYYANLPTRTTPAAGPLTGDLPPSVRNLRVKTASGTTTLGELGVNSYADLETKGGQAFDGGFNDPNTTYITSKFQELLGDNFNRVTAQNDGTSHAPGGHDRGIKTDFTIKDGNYSGAHAQISSYLSSQGMVEGKDFKIISRSHGSGPHIDFHLTDSGRQRVEQMRAAEQAISIPAVTQPRLNYGPNGVGIMPSMQGVDRLRRGGSDRRRPGTGTGFGMGIARNPVMGGAGTLPYMDAGYDPLLGTTRMYKDGLQVATGSHYLNPETGAPIGDFTYRVGRSIAEGIVDATIATPKQPTVVPLETNLGNPFEMPTPKAAGSEIAKNPSGTPRGATDKRPEIDNLSTMGDLSLLMINSDMLGH